MPVEIGISKVLGIKMFQAGDTIDYEKKAKVSADSLKSVNAIYVHIKDPTSLATMVTQGVKGRTSKILTDVSLVLMQELNKMDAVIVVSGDHSTPA